MPVTANMVKYHTATPEEQNNLVNQERPQNRF